MKKQARVSEIDEITDAVEAVEEEFASLPDEALSRVSCLLICEELLVHLVQAGYRNIGVSTARGGVPFVDISARGEVDSFEAPHVDDDYDRIGVEINQSILAAYDDYIDYRYRRGVNRYRVYLEPRKSADLGREIYEYYESADASAAERPLSLFRHVAGKHRAMAVFAVVNKSVKHLAALTLPVFAANIIDALTAGSGFFTQQILINVLASILALTVNLVCAWMDNRIYQRFTRSIEAGLKMAIVQKLQILSMKYHSDTPTGKLLTKLVSDVQFVKQLIYENFTDVLHLCLDIVFIVVVMLLRMPLMLLFYAVAIPLATGLIRRFLRPIRASKVQLRKKTEHSNAAFKEMLEMETLTRSQGLEATEYRNIFARVRAVRLEAIRYDRFQNRLNNVGYGSFQGCRLLCLCFAGYFATQGAIGIGSVVLFLSLFDTIVNSVQKVLDTMPQIVQGYDSLTSINEILLESDVENDGDEVLPKPVRGEIEFRDVVFGYDGQRPVLNGTNIQVPAGSSVAFIGESGSGKSTLLGLALGLYSPQAGQVLVDGYDVDKLNKASYRKHIAVVPQSTALFSGTLWDNLVYGLNYITTSEVLAALESVGLAEMVREHPDGLHMTVYENGDNFSGGQRQRIAIARALLRQPDILLFDEATSALDAESERQVQEAIEAVMGECTMLIVAHRLNTIRKVDAVYRIANGKAVRCEPSEYQG